ncbi:hypothetical protein THRCLA_23078 [Thraustotheca clavata]|uniref:Uncharacterized protein n=1 Tax=Thraustotheca clavata TaxID=74557 RepID=A0A1V9YF45_9STRA|nr:hypothetical protein THRCLA_23078 [Thraustotheca clavata]
MSSYSHYQFCSTASNQTTFCSDGDGIQIYLLVVDYLCTIAKERIAVSVTRAMKFPNPNAWKSADTIKLLRKKLSGLVIARAIDIALSIQSAYKFVVEELDIVENVFLVLTIASAEWCIILVLL